MADENENSDAEKTEEPSQHRIEEFRKRGEVASSKELTSVLVLAACISTLVLSIVFIYEQFATYIEWLYTIDLASAFTDKSLKTILSKTIMTALTCLAPIFIVAASVGVFASVAQTGLLFSPEVLQWDLGRVNPIKGMGRLFSMKSAVEALKGVFKFVIILGIVYAFIKDDLQSYQGFYHLEFIEAFTHGKWMLARLGFAILLGLVVIALGDFTYQKMSYRKKVMMTKEEAKKEHKEHEGNPEVRQKIRAIQRSMAQKRMMGDVPKADVIITNPTHFSIAIRYDKETMISPEIIAKGADHLALKIREIAKENGVPIVENVPLARTLYKTVKVGEAVPRTVYKAVAEVLAFVYKLKRKNKALK
jgi:flagellar biosynthetic protein FlhB